jgi:hypothetical protein
MKIMAICFCMVLAAIMPAYAPPPITVPGLTVLPPPPILPEKRQLSVTIFVMEITKDGGAEDHEYHCHSSLDDPGFDAATCVEVSR